MTIATTTTTSNNKKQRVPTTTPALTTITNNAIGEPSPTVYLTETAYPVSTFDAMG